MAKTTSKAYRLCDDRSGEAVMIKTGKKGTLTLFDEEEKVRKAIRHCPNQRSIFLEDQDKHALVQPIIFINGYLTIPNNQPITQAFLDAHPSNSANGGGWFESINEEQEAKESIEDEELKMDIMFAIRQMSKKKDGIHELRAVASVIYGSVDEAYNMGIEELKSVLYNQVEYDPSRFTDDNGNVNIFENDDASRKYLILKALKERVLKKSPNGKSMLWAKDSKKIVTAPVSVDLISYFSDYLTSEDGILVVEEIVKRS